MKRLGIFGGTFDPPHLGHATIARTARDQLQLDRVEVIPTRIPPHRDDASASAEDRLAMVELLCRRLRRINASSRELDRGGISYTVGTLEQVASEEPDAELFLIVGGDSYHDLPTWKSYERVVELAHVAVVWRPGKFGIDVLREEDRQRFAPATSAASADKKVYSLECPPLPVAARSIRERLARGIHPIPDLDPAVERYIRERRLYGVTQR